MNNTIVFIHALSPLHAGTGQGVDVIDLPIAKEKSTGIPFLPGSSIKGVLREQARNQKMLEEYSIFGSLELENAGAAVFTDARLLCLPVRSLAGTFAYVTSPYLLKRFVRDLEVVGEKDIPQVNTVLINNEVDCATATKTALGKKVYLEELDLIPNAQAEEWADYLSKLAFGEDWKEFFKQRFCVVHDDAMTFLLETATEVTARIRLEEDTKTVAKGALWYEESLPTESVLVGLVQTVSERRSRNGENAKALLSSQEILEKIKDLAKTPVQLGGKSSVGRGVCQLRFPPKAGGNHAKS